MGCGGGGEGEAPTPGGDAGHGCTQTRGSPHPPQDPPPTRASEEGQVAEKAWAARPSDAGFSDWGCVGNQVCPPSTRSPRRPPDRVTLEAPEANAARRGAMDDTAQTQLTSDQTDSVPHQAREEGS
ncbi:hypothetical protein P7K49_013182 [Saguinus oedipus]|uniref:Uncharacterized protein n=1 Tax=Saguinus oedipus TaxID=9490 RepID=A0ABQ9VF68_SAGOE|nr:hypothetical protein P7K49_013182 [Saguinus oedipus]